MFVLGFFSILRHNNLEQQDENSLDRERLRGRSNNTSASLGASAVKVEITLVVVSILPAIMSFYSTFTSWHRLSTMCLFWVFKSLTNQPF